MSSYEGKLGEWLKYVQQQADSADETDKKEESKAETKPEVPMDNAEVDWQKPEDAVVRDRMGRVPEDSLADLDDSIPIPPTFIHDAPEILDSGSRLFNDTDIPEVEDYLPFLRDPQPPARPEIRDPRLDHLAEGTGEPRPIIRKPEETKAPEPPAAKAEAPAPTPAPPPRKARVMKVTPKVQPREKPVKAAPPAGQNLEEVRKAWDKLPKHIQLLAGHQPDEVAQNSYAKEFDESREELIARLLDPTLSLEETARVLNVCPTTVRRYTNRGSLQHFRTAGNQRRFRLSDVLAFLESSTLPETNGHEQTDETLER